MAGGFFLPFYDTNKTMTKEQKDKLVAALRSGKYQQCMHTLARNKNGDAVAPSNPSAVSFCCLGVATLVLDLPEQYRVEASTQPIQGCTIISGVNQQQLTVMNDKGQSFAEIADHIDTLNTTTE